MPTASFVVAAAASRKVALAETKIENLMLNLLYDEQVLQVIMC